MWFTYVVVALSAVAFADASSAVAPPRVCKDMKLEHPTPSQKSTPPYTITTSTKVVKGGTPMEVVIKGNGADNTIRGFLLQARQGDRDKIVGKFTLPPNDNFAQLLDCDAPGNVVTHKKHDKKDDKRTVTYTWTPPAGFNGEIRFRATIAYGDEYWTGVKSAPVKVTV